jgi:hypothetical protein
MSFSQSGQFFLNIKPGSLYVFGVINAHRGGDIDAVVVHHQGSVSPFQEKNENGNTLFLIR